MEKWRKRGWCEKEVGRRISGEGNFERDLETEIK
jgi:hypothetical protein